MTMTHRSEEQEKALAQIAYRYQHGQLTLEGTLQAIWDAREAEIERLRGELASEKDQHRGTLNRVAYSEAKTRELEVALAAARERVAELEGFVRDRDSLRVKVETGARQMSELRRDNRALGAELSETQEALGKSDKAEREQRQRAEQAERERDEARNVVDDVAEALGRLTEMQSMDAGPVYCSRAVDEIRDELRALLAAKEGT